MRQPIDLQRPAAIPRRQLQQRCLKHHLGGVAAAARREGATKTQHYLQQVWDGKLEAATYGPAQYLRAVRQRSQREALAQLRTGSHWLAEETGRRTNPSTPREQRTCPHCSGGAVEDAAHMVFDCPSYAPLRARWADLFEEQPATLYSFLQQPPVRVASFVHACRMSTQPPPS